MPLPRGRSLTITAFVDASHAVNKITRRSHSGYVIFLNRAPIVWYSKRQNTVETSTFSAEFIALKVCLEAIEHLRFKLRCFGIPMPQGEPTYVYCDNESVVRIPRTWIRLWTRNIRRLPTITAVGLLPLGWFHLLISVHMTTSPIALRSVCRSVPGLIYSANGPIECLQIEIEFSPTMLVLHSRGPSKTRYGIRRYGKVQRDIAHSHRRAHLDESSYASLFRAT